MAVASDSGSDDTDMLTTLYLNVKVAFEAFDEDNEGARQVVPRWGLDRLASILWSCPNQETLWR